MKTKDKVLLWLLVIGGVIGFLYLIKGMLLPFVVALIVAYFLDPAVDRLETWRLPRVMASTFIIAAFFSIVGVVILLVTPLLHDQFIAFSIKVPLYANVLNEKILPEITRFLYRIDPEALENAKKVVSNFSSQILQFFVNFLGNIWNSGLAVINLLSLVFITPIVTFYMLRDWDLMIRKVNSLLPPRYAPAIREQARNIDRTLAGYIRGQTQVCLILGTFYALGLSVVGLDFGLFVGLVTGVLSFIPYVGMLFGTLIGLFIAFFQFGTIVGISKVALIFILGQVIEGNFITPKLVGDKVGLHPVWIIFGMLAGAAIFGFVGILLAVPVTAVTGVLVRFMLEKYMGSPLYKGKRLVPARKK